MVPRIVARSLSSEECDSDDGEVHGDGGGVKEGEGFGNPNNELVLGLRVSSLSLLQFQRSFLLCF